jgi:hypothetical protein
MSSSQVKIAIPSLTKPEANELKRIAPDGTFEFHEDMLGEGKFGELLSATAIAWLTKIAVGALVTWWLRTRTKEKFTAVLDVIKTDGTTIRLQVEIDRSSQQAPQAQAIEQIRKLLAAEGLPDLED